MASRKVDTHRMRVRRFRWAMGWTAVVAAVAAFVLTLAQVLAIPVPVYSATLAAFTGLAVAVLLGAIIALLLAGTYASDRNTIRRLVDPAWPYITRATTWGLAGAGIAALLATALPARLLVPPASPSELPISGWLAVFGGALGIAAGLLEAWSEGFSAEQESPEPAASGDSPAERASPSLEN